MNLKPKTTFKKVTKPAKKSKKSLELHKKPKALKKPSKIRATTEKKSKAIKSKAQATAVSSPSKSKGTLLRQRFVPTKPKKIVIDPQRAVAGMFVIKFVEVATSGSAQRD